MAWLWKKPAADGSTIWIIGYRGHDGKVKNKSLGKWLRKVDAKKLLSEFERSRSFIDAGLAHEIPNHFPMEDFRTKHHEYSEANKSPLTVKRDDEILRNFASFTGNIPLVKVTRQTIDNYITHRREAIAPATMNVELRHLRAAFNLAVRWELIYQSPMKGVKLLRLPETDVPKFLELEQITRFLNALKDDPILPLARFYLLTGARRKEGILIKGEDIDMKRGLVHFRGEWTKSKQNRSIPFNQLPELRALLEAQNTRTGHPAFPSSLGEKQTWCADWVSSRISKIFNSIDLSWATTHTLRHTFASHLVMQGVEMFTVSRLLGHSSVVVTEKHYAHLAPRHAENAISKLPYSG